MQPVMSADVQCLLVRSVVEMHDKSDKASLYGQDLHKCTYVDTVRST